MASERDLGSESVGGCQLRSRGGMCRCRFLCRVHVRFYGSGREGVLGRGMVGGLGLRLIILS